MDEYQSSLTDEQWRDVVGYEGQYQISDLGQVFSLKCYKMLRSRPTKLGYHQVRLCAKDNGIERYVHRLVLEAFVGPCPDGYETCHKDEDKSNNQLSNLRWDTHQANVRENSNHRGGGKGRPPKPIKRGDGRVFSSAREAAQQVGCSARMIRDVCRGKYKIAKGYSWEYVNEKIRYSDL